MITELDCMTVIAKQLPDDGIKQTIYSAELYLLRKIAETSSDMVKARNWPEFRDACGGQDKLDADHATALHEYEIWLAYGEG